MKSSTRIDLAFMLSLIFGVAISFVNRQNFLLALQSGFIFAMLATVIVTLLSWGVDLAVKKGYSAWVGLAFVLILNVIGLLFLVIMPRRDY